MALAVRLAAKGRGRTSPNPMVGAVVVSGRRIVGQGYHRRPGGPHAEVLALRSAGGRAHGATLYVTLEPCHHTSKRTPPCVPAIMESGLRRVVVAIRDPNPLVSGRGISRLRRAGVRVTVGCLREEAERLNEIYCHWMRTGRPFVIMKAAMTLDGKVAAASGESRWITGEAARRHAHRLRSQVDAVMVGIGTVLRDDPQMTVRLADPCGRGQHAPHLTGSSRAVAGRLDWSGVRCRGRHHGPSSQGADRAAPSEGRPGGRSAGSTRASIPTRLLNPSRADGHHQLVDRGRKRTECVGTEGRTGEPRAVLHRPDSVGRARCQRRDRRTGPAAVGGRSPSDGPPDAADRQGPPH